MSQPQIINGKYRIDAPLGAGGMAVVYRATNLRTRQACAIKLVSPQWAARRDVVERFLREAQVGAQLGRHPGIVDTLDADEDGERGVPFLVMELLEGETLQARLLRGPLPAAEAALLLSQLGDALAFAHERGVVHRDLKPGNLFLTRDHRGNPLLKVLDFGIAKVLQEAETHAATEIGTPFYAAPEQMGPELRQLALSQGLAVASGVSPATDVWALGLVAFEALTGAAPGQLWGSTSPQGLPLRMAAAMAARRLPLASEQAGPRAALLPPGFDPWEQRCLAFDARLRWPSAREATEALLALLAAPLAAAPLAPGAPAAPAAAPTPGAPGAETQLGVQTFAPGAPAISSPPAASLHPGVQAAATRLPGVSTFVPGSPATPPQVAPPQPAPPQVAPASPTPAALAASAQALTPAPLPATVPDPPSQPGVAAPARPRWRLALVAGAGVAALSLGAILIAALLQDPPAPPGARARPSAAPAATSAAPSAAASSTTSAAASAQGAATANLARRPRVLIGNLSSSGPSSDQIQRAVQAAIPRLQLCYEAGLRVDPSITGSLSLRFNIVSGGIVGSVSGGGPLDASVTACVKATLGALRLPGAGVGSVSVALTFALE